MSEQSIVPIERIDRAILLLRSQKVILDHTLAELYEVETGALNRAVQRNRSRFPDDFMIQLTEEEAEFLRCQFGISNEGRGGRRYLPYAFTEQGVAMLSSVLRFSVLSHAIKSLYVNKGLFCDRRPKDPIIAQNRQWVICIQKSG